MASRGGKPLTQRSASSQQSAGGGSQGGTKRAANRWSGAPTDQVNGTTSREASTSRSQQSGLDESSTRRMHERIVFLLMSLVGARVVATVREGIHYEGILSTATTEGEISIALKHVRNLDQPETPAKKSLILLAKDLVDVTAKDVDLERRILTAASGSSGADTFRTDTDISGPGPAGNGRLLQKWSPGENTSSLGLEEAGVNRRSNNTAWDQFAVNERMFGSKTNYDEELYTTRLDRTGADYKARERKADQMAAEILSGSSSNPHILEERNDAVSSADQGVDEEDRYGAVIRGPNAYVPPGARTAQPARKANGDAANPDISPHVNTPNGREATESPLLVKQPSQILATSAAMQPGVTVRAAVTAGVQGSLITSEQMDSSSSLNQLGPDWKNFVQSEKERMVAKRQAQVKKDKESKLADMVSWSKSFSLKQPIPKDLMPILAQDPDKQREILEKAKDAARNTTQLTSKAGATSLASNTPIDASAAKQTAAGMSARASSSSSRGGETILPGAALKAPRFAERPVPITRESIAQIPPFNALKHRGTSGASSPAPPLPQTPSASSPVPPAPAPANTAAKLNPNVVAFVPGMASASAASTSPAPRSVDPLPVASTSNNPFFGSRSIKRGSSLMQVKEEFTPFKVSSTTPMAATIPDNWGFQGKSTKEQAAAFLAATLPAPPEEVIAVVNAPQGAPQAIPGAPGQGLPPHFSMFRYPPQFVYAGGQPYPVGPGAPGGPFPAQFVGASGFPQAGLPPFSQTSGQPGFMPVYRGGQPQMPVYFSAQHGGPPQQMAQIHSPPPGPYRRLSSASSGAGAGTQPSPSPFPPQMYAPSYALSPSTPAPSQPS